MLTQANTPSVVSLPMGMDAHQTSSQIQSDMPEKIGLSHSDPNYVSHGHLDVAKPHSVPATESNEARAQPLMVQNAVQKHVERLLTVISQSNLATGETLAHAHEAHDAMMKMLSSLEPAH